MLCLQEWSNPLLNIGLPVPTAIKLGLVDQVPQNWKLLYKIIPRYLFSCPAVGAFRRGVEAEFRRLVPNELSL